MKRSIVMTALAAVSITILNFGPAPAARAFEGDGCSLAQAAGFWGYTYTGVLILPSGAVPLAAVGRYSQDAAGNVLGTQSRSVGGTSATETVTGKMTVNPNCTGVLNAKVYQGGVFQRSAVLDAVFVNNMTHLRVIFQKLVLSNGTEVPTVITLEGNRLFRGGGD